MADNIVLNYVWINGFRGLNNVGFNLGGEYRYKMEQDGAGNYELTQTKNEKYVERFFSYGENENNISLVSAIVGNNGAGKTSFMQVLRAILLNSTFATDFPRFPSYLLIYTEGNQIICYKSVGLKNKILKSDTTYPKIETLKSPKTINDRFSSIFYSSMLDGSIYHDKLRSQLMFNRGNFKAHMDVSSNALYEEEKTKYRDESLKRKHPRLELLDWEDTERQIQFKNFAEDFVEKHCEIIKVPKDMTVYLHNGNPFFEKMEQKRREKKQKMKEKKVSEKKTLSADAILDLLFPIDEKLKRLEKNEEYSILESIFYLLGNALLSIHGKIRGNQELILSVDEKIKLIHYQNLSVKDSIKALLKSIIDSLDKKSLLDINEEKEQLYLLSDSIIELYNSDAYEKRMEFCKIVPGKYKEFSEKNRVLNELLGMFVLYCKNSKGYQFRSSSEYQNFNLFSFDWSELSTGEKLIFNLFSRFHYAKKKMEENGVDDASSVLILIDEGELGFHLEWQRKYIDALVEVLPLILGKDRPLQIIFTTHSPVSLSDIPRDNVVFLEKKETEESKKKGKEKGNAPEDKEYVVEVVDDPIETFGANIHAIVRNGFFLKDGAMGEFAKRKITKIFKSISKGEHSKRLEKEIDLIDEPIIRRQLKKKYEENLSIEEKINLRKAEIEELQAQLNKKEHDQNK